MTSSSILKRILKQRLASAFIDVFIDLAPDRIRQFDADGIQTGLVLP
jgi:hypothetical protein